MIRNKYEKILDQFERYYPTIFEHAVDWWATGRMSVAVKLNDGTTFEYNHIENTIRKIQTDTNPDDSSMTKSFGMNLQKRIPFSGMSNIQLAEKLGITNAMLSRYIHGNSTPSVVKAFRIAKTLGCTVDELFDETFIE